MSTFVYNFITIYVCDYIIHTSYFSVGCFFCFFPPFSFLFFSLFFHFLFLFSFLIWLSYPYLLIHKHSCKISAYPSAFFFCTHILLKEQLFNTHIQREKYSCRDFFYHLLYKITSNFNVHIHLNFSIKSRFFFKSLFILFILIVVASLVAEYGFQAHSLQQLWHAGSVVVAHGLSCSVACGIFLDQGSNQCPLHWVPKKMLGYSCEYLQLNFSQATNHYFFNLFQSFTKDQKLSFPSYKSLFFKSILEFYQRPETISQVFRNHFLPSLTLKYVSTFSIDIDIKILSLYLF